MGFPLIYNGTNIKLTDGIISSSKGFMNDATSYQLSSPVQPGNSGGPVFNRNGELIAIITSKHLGTERTCPTL
ncbi:MAG: trypsin-like peptidase domain-containing protein [Saprospiraceae bacterium]|nr:trypsin-like peptidase domain-containing protein [Saprospiraceae bacterium]